MNFKNYYFNKTATCIRSQKVINPRALLHPLQFNLHATGLDYMVNIKHFCSTIDSLKLFSFRYFVLLEALIKTVERKSSMRVRSASLALNKLADCETCVIRLCLFGTPVCKRVDSIES